MTHPLVRTGRRYVIAGGLMAGAAGAFALAIGSSSIGVAALGCLMGALLIWNGRALTTSGTAIPLLQRSLALVTKGQLDEAERVADALPPTRPRCR